MELKDVMKEKFGAMPLEQLKIVIMAMSPCSNGRVWLNEYRGDNLFDDAPIAYLSWFAAPFLSRADLHRADLFNADLFNAYLRRADLSGADLRRADLRRAYLSRADLRGAYLSGAYLRRAYLRDAKYNKSTTFTEGFDPESNGMVLVE